MSRTVMNWPQLLSPQRYKIRDQRIQPTNLETPLTQVDMSRNDFHIDHDRVVFSSAFRRLGRKTQVHPLATHDHMHNRLTHSVEVGCVGRSLGNRVGAMLEAGGYLPPESSATMIGNIVQVACLAHDIGNPPFGHTGEDALREWFLRPEHAWLLTPLTAVQQRDIQTYEGNAHGLRVLATLEMYRESGGMRLSAATLGTLLKYPWTSEYTDERKKYSIYQAELPYFRQIAEDLGLLELRPNYWARHPLSYLMEAADDICYAILDLEDAVELGMLDVAEFENLLSPLAEIERIWLERDPRQKCAMLRGMGVGRCVNEIADVFMRHHTALLAGEFPAHDLLAASDARIGETLLAAKELANRKVYHHHDKLLMEVAAYPCLAGLLSLLVPAAYGVCVRGRVTQRERLALELLEYPLRPECGLYQAYLEILDFVGGLTDNTAARFARELSGLGL